MSQGLLVERHFQHMIGQIRESINRLTLNNSDGSYEQLLGEERMGKKYV